MFELEYQLQFGSTFEACALCGMRSALHTFGELVSGEVAVHVVHASGPEAAEVTGQWRSTEGHHATVVWDCVSSLLWDPAHGRSFWAVLRCAVRCCFRRSR